MHDRPLACKGLIRGWFGESIMSRQQSGFTLVEIMIAVAILAVIAAIAIPAYQGYIETSRYGTARQDMRQMQLILDDLASENDLAALDGAVTTVQGLYIASDGSILIDDNDQSTSPAGASPWLDPWGSMYRYQRANSTNQDYILWSFGPDGADNTGGGDDATPT